MRDIYMSLESLRNSADLLSKHIGHWASLRNRPQPHKGVQWMEHRRSLWDALGIQAEIAETLVDLQLSFVQGTIHVWEDAHVGSDFVGSVCAALMGTWRFVPFTTSRWLTVGTSARTMVAALATGLPNFVKYIEKETTSNLPFLKGFHRLQEEGKTFMVAAAMSSRIVEGFQSELMEVVVE